MEREDQSVEIVAGDEATEVKPGAEVEAPKKIQSEYDRVKAALLKAKEGLPSESDPKAPGARAKDADAPTKEKVTTKEEVPTKAEKVEAASKPEKVEAASKPEKTQKAIPSRNLTDEEREALEKAPDVIKKAFARREKELGNSANALNSKLGAVEKELQEVRKTRDPIWKKAEAEAKTLTALLKSAGREEDVDASTYISELISADKRSRKDPVEYIRAFAKANSVDLDAIARGEQGFDYQTHTASQEMATLRAEIEELKREKARASEMATRASTEELQRGVMQIAQDYVADLEGDDVILFDSLSSQLFQKAEQEAIATGRQVDYATLLKEVFAKTRSMMPSVAERAKSREAEAASARVQKAQSLAISPASKRGGVSSGPTSLQERIRQNARAMGILSR